MVLETPTNLEFISCITQVQEHKLAACQAFCSVTKNESCEVLSSILSSLWWDGEQFGLLPSLVWGCQLSSFEADLLRSTTTVLCGSLL